MGPPDGSTGCATPAESAIWLASEFFGLQKNLKRELCHSYKMVLENRRFSAKNHKKRAGFPALCVVSIIFFCPFGRSVFYVVGECGCNC